MKLLCIDTGRKTEIKKDEFGWYEYKEAVNRLIAHVMPGHIGDSIAHLNLENRPETREFSVEAVRGIGGMTEHTGEKFEFRIIKELNRAAAAMGRKGGAVKSDRKTAASRKNGRMGGRPKKAKKSD
jgi:hypothetical protein